MAWEKKVGIMGKNGSCAAQKRRTVEPVHQATSKLQKMTNSIGFGERQKVMEEWNEEEDEDDNFEFWRDEDEAISSSTAV